MGSNFRITTGLTDQNQQSYVPRSPDNFGGGPQGTRLVAQVFGEEVLFSNLAITTTTTQNSLPPLATNPTRIAFDQVYAVNKTAVGTSTLNQSVSIQPVWSRDATTWFAFGSATIVAASTGPAVPFVIALSTPTQYLPYVGLQATCATAPTSGALNAWLERLG